MAPAERALWLGVVGMLEILACATEDRVMSGRQTQEVHLADEPEALLQMKRNGCPDEPCPVYSISIFADGTAIYDGRANVGVVGRRTLKVRASELCALITTLDAMDFLDTAEDCCTCTEPTKPPTVTLAYRPGAVAKTVVHDQHCAKVPAAFARIEQQIDRATGSDRMASLRGHEVPK